MQTFLTYLCFTFYRLEFSLISSRVGALWDLDSAHLTCFTSHYTHEHVLCALIRNPFEICLLPSLPPLLLLWSSALSVTCLDSKKRPRVALQVATPALPPFSLRSNQWYHESSSGSPIYFGIKSRLLGSLATVGSLPSSLSPSLSVCLQMHSDTPAPAWHTLPPLFHTCVPTAWSSLRWGHRSQACFSFLVAGLSCTYWPGVFASLWHCIVSPRSLFVPLVQSFSLGPQLRTWHRGGHGVVKRTMQILTLGLCNCWILFPEHLVFI